MIYVVKSSCKVLVHAAQCGIPLVNLMKNKSA